MSVNKIRYPGPGCLVEFMQGNSPMLAVVLEENNGRLRLYAANRRESALAASRALPWAGPSLGQTLSRQAMDQAMEERRALRAAIAAEIAPLEIWELVQGEVGKTTAEWLAGLVWEQPTVDQEAALGHALLAAKSHFRFSPPEFEVFSAEVVEARLAEAEQNRIREAFAVTGAQFFQTLWDSRTGKRGPITPQEMPEAELADKLKALVFTRLADPDTSEDAAVWKLLVKGLPDVAHLPLMLAESWGLVPEHYNYHLDRIGFDPGEEWANAFTADSETLISANKRALAALEADTLPYVSVDPAEAKDRDDAFYVEKHPDGSYSAHISLACPALPWPFGTPLDKAVLRRASSIYLPEGDEHMLPAAIGRELFGLDAGQKRPSLVLTAHISAEGDILSAEPSVRAVSGIINLSLEESEACLAAPAAPDLPAHAAMLALALELARLLQERRIACGAVITERPDPEVRVVTENGESVVHIDPGPNVPLSHLVVGEMMILCNSQLAEWGLKRSVPLLYRTQDVALPREFAGIWTEPQDISRVVRALPPASLEATPRKHAGLGLAAYATFSSPIRRYSDLINQGQVISYLSSGAPRLTQDALIALLPMMSAASDAVGQVQRQRPRYWKLLFFRQHGDKQWWDAVVADENEAFATISLPWAHLLVRGKRRRLEEKLYPGMRIQVRLGKVNPLMGEIQVLEAREA